jgi:hypothetical protein
LKVKLYAVLKIGFGTYLFFAGFAPGYFKATGRDFPASLDWWLSAVNHSAVFGTINVFVYVIFGATFIWAGQRDLKFSRR